ncbi:MAG: hypothetical protein ACRDY3_00105 [Acidimicrobiales bacterium]
MSITLALVIGYVIGAKSGGKDLERLRRSLKALYDTDELADVISSARAQAGSTLRAWAAVVDGEDRPSDAGGDLVARVTSLLGHDRP